MNFRTILHFIWPSPARGFSTDKTTRPTSCKKKHLPVPGVQTPFGWGTNNSGTNMSTRPEWVHWWEVFSTNQEKEAPPRQDNKKIRCSLPAGMTFHILSGTECLGATAKHMWDVWSIRCSSVSPKKSQGFLRFHKWMKAQCDYSA